MLPMTSVETVNILNAMLKNDLLQVIPTKITEAVNEFLNVDPTANLISIENNSPISILNVAAAIKAFQTKLSAVIDNKLWLTKLNHIASFQIVELLANLGMDITPDKIFSLNSLLETLHAQEKFLPLLHAMLDVLVRSGFVKSIKDMYIFTDKVCKNNTLPELSQLQQEYPQSASWLKLFRVALTNFKNIIQGVSRATDHFFPHSSFDLVESIYSHNQLSNYFNEMLVAAVLAGIQEHGKIRILEFGAGTGGTAHSLLKQLKQYSDRIEYVFSDVSQHFVNKAKQALSIEYPFVSFVTYDIEQDVQSFDYGSFDIVLGTNVLHIAADLFTTIARLKRLLKNNGLFILNELTSSFDIYTLTFGLLDGWWLKQDDFLRLPHSPLVSADRWRFILDVLGFKQINTFSDEESIQSLIIAASDGLIKCSANLPIQLRDKAKEVVADKALSFADVESAVLPKRKLLLHSYIKQEIASILEINDIEEIKMDRPLSELGMDSLIVIDFCNNLSKTMGKMISTNIIFDYPTLSSLIEYIATDILKWREEELTLSAIHEIEEMLKQELGEIA
jgi:SAM-dependent methyltransferase